MVQYRLFSGRVNRFEFGWPTTTDPAWKPPIPGFPVKLALYRNALARH
jgi:hypothetical protein